MTLRRSWNGVAVRAGAARTVVPAIGVAAVWAALSLAGTPPPDSPVLEGDARPLMHGAASVGTAPAAKTVSPQLTTAGVKAIRREISAHKGAPLLVNFWATWCEPCVEELPDLAKLESKFAAKRLKLLGVSCDLLIEDNSAPLRQKVVHTLSESGVSYPNFLYEGRGDPLIQAFNLPGPIPHTILFGADGKELKRWTGRLDMASLEHVLGEL